MELIQTLRTIIHNKYRREIKNPGFFILEDESPGSTKKPPPSFLQYRPDKAFLPCVFDTSDSNKEIFQFFDVSVKGVSRMCDYILFYEKKDKKKKARSRTFVFLCELKANRGEENKQLEAAQIFAEYIVKTAVRLLKFKPFQVEYRALVFSDSQRTRFKSNLKNEKYEPLGNSGLRQLRLRAGSNCALELLAK